MNDKRFIAQYLYDIAEESKSEVIEVALDSELVKIAKKMNIVVPNPDIAIIKTVYAKVITPNRNGISLPRKAVEKGLPTLVGKLANWSHLGKNHICGWILDAKLEEDFIITYISIFKSAFNEEFETVKEMFKEGSLSVSFEIWNRTEEGKTVLHDLGNGVRSIDPIIFHGVGILIGKNETPACPEAYAKKLLAIFKKDTIKDAENIINSNTEADLIYASSILDELECQKCNKCQLENKEVKTVEIPKEIEQIVAEEAQKKEEIKIEEILDNDYEGGEIEEAKKLTTEQRNALPDSDFALIQEKDGKKIRRFPINDEAHVRNALARLPQAKNITEEERKSALEKILKKAKELNMTELLKKYEKAEETPTEEVKAEEKKEELKPEEAKEKPEAEEKMENLEPTRVTEPAQEQKIEERVQVAEVTVNPKKLVKIIRYSIEISEETLAESGSTFTKSAKEKIVMVYDDNSEEVVETDAQVVQKYTQAQLEEAVNKAKEELQAIHKAEIEAKTNEVKSELEKKITEKETEIATLKTQIEQKTQEVAKLTAKKEEESKPTLEVGNVDKKDTNHYKERQKKINLKAYGHE